MGRLGHFSPCSVAEGSRRSSSHHHAGHAVPDAPRHLGLPRRPLLRRPLERRPLHPLANPHVAPRVAQNRHGQRQPLHVEHFAQPPTGERGAMRSPFLRKSTQLLERRRAFGPERAHAEPRMEGLLRGRVAAKPVEALEQRAAAPARKSIRESGTRRWRDNLVYALHARPRRAFGHQGSTDRTPAVCDPAQRFLNARPAKDVQTRRVHRIR